MLLRKADAQIGIWLRPNPGMVDIVTPDKKITLFTDQIISKECLKIKDIFPYRFRFQAKHNSEENDC